MQKIVINKEVGGFELPVPALIKYAEFKGIEFTFYTKYFGDDFAELKAYKRLTLKEAEEAFIVEPMLKDLGESVDNIWDFVDERFNIYEMNRDDLALVQTVDALTKELPELKIVEIPDNVKWQIEENDMGCEWIAEVHRTWS